MLKACPLPLQTSVDVHRGKDFEAEGGKRFSPVYTHGYILLEPPLFRRPHPFSPTSLSPRGYNVQRTCLAARSSGTTSTPTAVCAAPAPRSHPLLTWPTAGWPLKGACASRSVLFFRQFRHRRGSHRERRPTTRWCGLVVVSLRCPAPPNWDLESSIPAGKACFVPAALAPPPVTAGRV